MLLNVFRINILNFDPRLGMDPGVNQRLSQGLIGFCQVNILAHHRDADFVLRMFKRVHQLVPHRQVCGGRV